MTPRLLFVATTLALLASASGAEQKTVYRCGQAYQDSPCPGGKLIDAADPRSEDQRQAGLEAARQQADLGERLQRERLEQERHQRVLGAANLGARPPAALHAEPEHKFKPKKPKKAKETVRSTLKPSRPPRPRKTDQAAG